MVSNNPEWKGSFNPERQDFHGLKPDLKDVSDKDEMAKDVADKNRPYRESEDFMSTLNKIIKTYHPNTGGNKKYGN